MTYMVGFSKTFFFPCKISLEAINYGFLFRRGTGQGGPRGEWGKCSFFILYLFLKNISPGII